MRVLVTGSEGFIGKNLVAALERRGDEVIGLDAKTNFHVGGTTLGSKDYGVEAIYHLACCNQMQAVDDPIENWLTNAHGTREIAYWAKKSGAKLIYTSTASVYGQQSLLPIKRTAYVNPMSDYAVAKLAGEHFVKNSGCDYTILRLSNVYGPYQTTDNPYCGVIGRFIEAAIEDKPLTVIGDGKQSRDFTYVDDVVDVLLKVAHEEERPYRSVYNVSHGEDVSINKLVSTLQRLLETPLTIDVDAPERPVDTIKHRVLRSDFKCPTTLSEGLTRTLEWFAGQ